MNYYFTSFFYIFIIILVSSLIQTRIKAYQSLSLSIAVSLISLIIFLTPYKNSFFLLIILIFLLTAYEFKGIKIKIFNYNNIRFLWYSFFLIFFCYSRYFLDEDELTFWGINQKYLYLENLYTNTQKINKLSELYYVKYHSLLIPKFKAILNIFFEPREDSLILINNLIILTCFFSLFKSTKSNLIFQFFYFLIFYCILNLLSFGFNSIYADILVVLFSILLFKILIIENFAFEKTLQSLIIFCLILQIFLIHRIGSIFILIIILNYLIFNYRNFFFKKKFYLFIFLIIFSLYIQKYINFSNYNLAVIKNIVFNLDIIFLNYLNYINELIHYKMPYIFIFGFFNDSLNFFNFNFNFPQYNIIFYQCLIFFLFVNAFFFKKKKIFFISFLNLFIFSFSIYLAKVLLEINLHPYATVRYLMMFFLFDFIIKLSIKFNSMYKKKNLYIIIIFLSLIVPSKSIGFILPKDIYLMDKKNNDYYKFINKLKNLKKDIENKYDQKENIRIYIINNYSFTSLENSRIIYEFYPKVSKASILSLEEFENSILDINYINIVIAEDNFKSIHSNYIFKRL